MAKNIDKRRLWLVVGGAVLLSGGVTALGLMDVREAEGVEEEIVALEARIASANVEIAKTREREDEVLVFRAVQPRELEILPRQQQIAGFHSNLTTILQQAGARFTKLPDNAPKESELARGVFVTPNTVEFEADAASLLKFINIVEVDERLVAVKGLKVKSGGRAKEEAEQPVHRVVVNLETYYYNPPADQRTLVPIANEAERLEDASIKARIAQFQPERRDTYTLRPATSRRDPFIDFRKEVIKEDPEVLRKRFEAEEAVVLDLERRSDDVREKAEEEAALSSSGNYFVRDRVARELDGLLNDLRLRIANAASVKSVTLPELFARVDKVRAATEGLAATRKDLPRDFTVSAEVASDTLTQIEAQLREGQYASVTSLWVAWEAFLRGKVVDPAALPVLERIKAVRHRAKAVAEFEGLGLEVTGVMVNPTNPDVAVALVNGRSVRRGEPVLGHDDVLVLDVRRDGVDFQYQGERIFRRRQEGGSASAQGPGGRGQPVKAPGRGAPPAGNRSGATGAKAPAASADRTPKNPPAPAPMTDPTVPADPGR